MQIGCEAKQRLIAALFFAQLMALQFEIRDCRGHKMEDSRSAILRALARVLLARVPLRAGLHRRQSGRSAGGKLFEVFKRRGAFRLGRFAHFEARNQLAKILIASLRCAEQQ